jgi:predicted nucleotidyltransferase
MVYVSEKVREKVMAAGVVAHRLFPTQTQKTYLYGSHGLGCPREDSDVDVVITTSGINSHFDQENFDLTVICALEAMRVYCGEGPGEVHLISYSQQQWDHPLLVLNPFPEIIIESKKSAVFIV